MNMQDKSGALGLMNIYLGFINIHNRAFAALVNIYDSAFAYS